MPIEEVLSQTAVKEITKRFTYSEAEIKAILGAKHNQTDMTKVVTGSDGTGITVAVTVTKTVIV